MVHSICESSYVSVLIWESIANEESYINLLNNLFLLLLTNLPSDTIFQQDPAVPQYCWAVEQLLDGTYQIGVLREVVLHFCQLGST